MNGGFVALLKRQVSTHVLIAIRWKPKLIVHNLRDRRHFWRREGGDSSRLWEKSTMQKRKVSHSSKMLFSRSSPRAWLLLHVGLALSSVSPKIRMKIALVSHTKLITTWSPAFWSRFRRVFCVLVTRTWIWVRLLTLSPHRPLLIYSFSHCHFYGIYFTTISWKTWYDLSASKIFHFFLVVLYSRNQ